MLTGTSQPRIAQNGNRLSDVIAEQVLDDIIAGRIKPGEGLVEAKLAARFKASRAPVREALQQLEREGAIEIIPRVGARVLGFSAQDVSDLYDLRIALEAHAVLRLVIDDRALAELYEILRLLRSAVLQRNLHQVIQYDLDLHEAMCRLSQNRRLFTSWQSLRRQAVALYLFMIAKLDFPLDELADSHEGILAALHAGDRQLAVLRLTQHIEMTRLQLVALLRNLDTPDTTAST